MARARFSPDAAWENFGSYGPEDVESKRLAEAREVVLMCVEGAKKSIRGAIGRRSLSPTD